MAMTTIPYTTRQRARAAARARARPRIVYRTRFNDYLCEDDTCVEVTDALTGEPSTEHPCLGMVAIAALDVSRFAAQAVACAAQARPGQYLRFTPPTLDGPDIVTTEIEGVEYRLHASGPAATCPGDGAAILSVTSTLEAARVVYVDHPFARMNGSSLDQLRTDPLLLLAGTTPRIAYLRAIEAALRARSDQPILALQRKTRPDGTYLDARVRIDLERSLDGAMRLVLVERDTTPTGT